MSNYSCDDHIARTIAVYIHKSGMGVAAAAGHDKHSIGPGSSNGRVGNVEPRNETGGGMDICS